MALRVPTIPRKRFEIDLEWNRVADGETAPPWTLLYLQRHPLALFGRNHPSSDSFHPSRTPNLNWSLTNSVPSTFPKLPEISRTDQHNFTNLLRLLFASPIPLVGECSRRTHGLSRAHVMHHPLGEEACATWLSARCLRRWDSRSSALGLPVPLFHLEIQSVLPFEL